MKLIVVGLLLLATTALCCQPLAKVPDEPKKPGEDVTPPKKPEDDVTPPKKPEDDKTPQEKANEEEKVKKAQALQAAKMAKETAENELADAKKEENQNKITDGNAAETEKEQLDKIKDTLQKYKDAKAAKDAAPADQEKIAAEMTAKAAVEALEDPYKQPDMLEANLTDVNNKINEAQAKINKGKEAKQAIDDAQIKFDKANEEYNKLNKP
ncbi:hypothetical protein L596_016782 [Steinernema carpocapsae]|uniref:Uncharacterized protein n=1 Tax=Steinernema carpocapsae TaxID=34508 RepID=A0A4V6A3H5_STECR|nr:hypothetical protein L596_016782 [Steinernema carpocapsae]